MLKPRGTRLVLGLRDVMDDPRALATEWRRKNPTPALRDLYDDILVYGLPEICNPLAGLDLPRQITDKVTYTGYLRSRYPSGQPPSDAVRLFDEPYVLVTPGGGGDGEQLIDWVLGAYEHDRNLPYGALIVFGPFMHPRRRARFRSRVEKLERVEALTFETRVEQLMANAAGVVAMGGYNTFCEMLTFDRPAVVVPRRRPRMEQHIRASRAQSLGLVRMLSGDRGRDPAAMAEALRAMPRQQRPSDIVVPGLLDGLDRVHSLVEEWLSLGRIAPRRSA